MKIRKKLQLLEESELRIFQKILYMSLICIYDKRQETRDRRLLALVNDVIRNKKWSKL